MGKKECPFCNPRPELVVAQNERALALFDLYPVNPGHALIVPKRHVSTPFELTPEEWNAVVALLNEVKALIDARFKPDGYNVGFNAGEAAGQTIDHAHVHLIPRYRGDDPDPTGGVRCVVCERKNYKKISGRTRSP